jgi:cytochrome c
VSGRAPAALAAAALLTACAPAAVDPAAPSPGARSYQRCYTCHSLEADGQPLDGPHLAGIVGRPIASVEGFAYSPALRALAAREARWTPELLDAFIADPEAIAPGNEMGFFGLADARERAALIAYLNDGGDG